MGLGIFIFAIGVLAGLAVPLLRLLPQRLPAWHNQLWKLYWRHKSRSRGGRPKFDAKLVSSIRRLSLEKPVWGAPRIHAELLKLGWIVAQSTVSNYMIPRSARPGAGWCSFIDNHRVNIVAIDMASVRTVSFGCFCGVGHP